MAGPAGNENAHVTAFLRFSRLLFFCRLCAENKGCRAEAKDVGR
jgi:hypothetical protein